LSRESELAMRYWDIWGEMPPSNPFRWWQPTSRKAWLDDLEADIEACEANLIDPFNPGP
jgi:hypothetical protein